MKKIIQAKEGENVFNFTVTTDLNLVVTAVHLKNADIHIQVRLTGRGATATITGIIIARGGEQIGLHTMQIHAAPETTSDLLIKSVLSDRAKCLYDGGIRVEKKAQKTDAYQRNENLLLTGRPYAESKPALEILANDVRCTHGSTTGPIDAEQLWYLTSRGIPVPSAQRIITEGFIMSALMRTGDSSIIRTLWQTLSLH
jgi:Fe-S cluster assembly protein SufD